MKKILKLFILVCFLLVAGCTKKTYLVIINGEPQKVMQNETIVLPKLEKEGYDFLGYKDENGNLYKNQVKITDHDLVLYPYFVLKKADNPEDPVKHQIHFEVTDVVNKTDFPDYQVVDGKFILKPTKTPLKEGFTFKYWSTKKDGQEFLFNEPIKNNLTLFPVFKKNEPDPVIPEKHKVHFELTGVQNKQDFKDYMLTDGEIIHKPTKTPVKPEFTFKYWSTEAEGPEFLFESPLKNDLTLFPVFMKKVVEITVRFHKTGLTNADLFGDYKILKGEKPLKLDLIPLKDGSVFKYFSKTSGGDKADYLENLQADTTYYPVFLTYLKDKDGNDFKYKSGVKLMVNELYHKDEGELRGVWLSMMTGDIQNFAYKTPEEAKAIIDEMISNIKAMKLNNIFFHLRAHNDAYYETNLAPLKYINPSVSGSGFDYVNYLIFRCHENGIKFHAWLNPYRIVNKSFKTPEEIKNMYSAVPKNPASKIENILQGKEKTSGAHDYILNPSKEEVKKYLLDVIKEIIERYDIDGIHFDDYFYIPLNGDPSSFMMLPEEERHARVGHVNDLVRRVYNLVREEEIVKNKKLAFGISPTGVYKIGNGVVTYDSEGNPITNGSAGGWGHYNSFLASDSLYWIKNEIIDYIIPQVYWAMDHRVAPFHDISKWWSDVVRYKKVKLYLGIGNYKYTEPGSKGWRDNQYEIANQILVSNSLDYASGVVFFRYKHLLEIKTNASNIQHEGFKRILNEYWL